MQQQFFKEKRGKNCKKIKKDKCLWFGKMKSTRCCKSHLKKIFVNFFHPFFTGISVDRIVMFIYNTSVFSFILRRCLYGNDISAEKKTEK